MCRGCGTASPGILEFVEKAIKYTPAGGKIVVRTTNPRPGTLRFTIRDNGVGIDPGKLPVIFRAFEQADANNSQLRSGLGLGLTITRAIVELHGGKILGRAPE